MRIVDAQMHICRTDLTGIPCTYRGAAVARGEDLEWIVGRGICQWLGWLLPKMC